MVNAASSKKIGIIKRTHPHLDPTQWDFEMFLCVDDMVLWDSEDPRFIKEGHCLLGEPIYRVQKISKSITFRHHSVSPADKTDKRGMLECSPSTLKCKKIIMNVMGGYTVES